MCFIVRFKHDLPQNNTLWTLLGYLVNIEADTRAIRDEDRGAINGVDQDGEFKAPGNGGAYKRWRMRNNLKNIISHREEYEPLEYLARVSHIDPW
jgi:hypothetical protein